MNTMANKEGARPEADSALRAELAERKRTEEELRQRQQESEDIRKILTATTRHLDLSSVLQEALHGTMGLTGLEGGTICLVNFEHQSLELAASVNTSAETIADLTLNRIKIGDCLCGQCARDCQPLILWDNASGSLFATREATRKEGIRFHAAFPLQGRERCIGVLCLFARSDKQPTQRSLQLVLDLCGSIALAIENTRFFEAANRELAERRRAEEDLQRTNRTLRMISRCNQVLVRGTEEAALLRDICHIVVDDGGYRMAWVGFAKADEAKTIEPVAQAGFDAGYHQSLRLVWADSERGRGPAGSAIRTGQPCVVQNTLTEPRFALWRAEASKRGYASALGCPLLENGRAFGVLMIYAGAPQAFDPTEVQLLTELADNLAFGLVAIRTRARRELAEAGLRELSRKNEEALRVAHMGRWEFDVQSRQFTFNDQYYTLHGTTAAHAGGYQMGVEDFVRRFVHPHDAHLVGESIQKAVASEDPGFEFQTEARILRADGEVRTVLCWFRSERDARGTTVALHGVNQDITERKRAEEALQRSQGLLSESQAIAHLGSWELDLATNRLTWSDEVYRIFGLQPQEFGATYEAFLEAVHPEDRAAVKAAYSGSVREGKDTYEIEHRVVRKDNGDIRTVQEKCIHLKDAAGSIVRSIGMVHDITERKRAEAELRRHREHLEELVAARTAELEAANSQLESFSYSVSHDLRAPLRAIDGYAQILLRSGAASLPPPSQGMLEQICRQALRMGQLIDDLLTFSRLGRQAMQTVPLDLEALAREAFDEQSAAQPKCAAQITIHRLPPAFGDRAMMRVVLNNLLSNAIKYSRKRNPPLIEVGGFAEGAHHVYFVKDNGAGFDMEQADKLFGVFQRLHSREEFEGTGVGLALVQRIIQRHGGRVWAQAKVDQGATFFFALPRGKAGAG